MEEICRYSFVLDNANAAVTALVIDGCIHATDGANPCIYRFSSDGRQTCEIGTIRPYRRLRYDVSACGFTALGCCNLNRIYTLSDSFSECSYTELDISALKSRECLTEITDASVTSIENRQYVVAAFGKSAHLFDLEGKWIEKLCIADDSEHISDFIYPRAGLFAFGTFKSNRFSVTVTDNAVTHSAVLDKRYTLRQLFAVGDAIYGLFGQSYIYNRIIKIYENGILSLPD